MLAVEPVWRLEGVGRSTAVPDHQRNLKRTLRQGQWKFIKGELYDLENDLAEEHNLARKMPEKTKAMAERLGELMHSENRGE